MTGSGILGRVASGIASGAIKPSSLYPDHAGPLSSPVDILTDRAAWLAGIEMEADTLANDALGPLASLAVELRTTRTDGDPVASILAEHAAIPLQAAAYAALCNLMDGFKTSELCDQARTLNGQEPLGDPDRRNALAVLTLDRFRHGVSVLMIEVLRSPGNDAGGLN